LNSVHSITKARWTKPDSTHAIVVIGVGLDVPWQYTAFQLGLNLVDKTAATSSMGNAFRAPPGAAVYFGDYVLVSHDTVEFERNINAARAGAKELLPRGAVLELAESTTAPDARMFICTP
jgi:hypothetical protein